MSLRRLKHGIARGERLDLGPLGQYGRKESGVKAQAAFMTESNRSIWIVSAESKQTEEVVTGRSLRLLRGKREVSEALWRDRPVVVKVFHHPLKARYHYRRELRGLRGLAQLAIPAPVLLLSGRTRQGHWAIVTEKIQGASTGLELARGAESAQQRVDVLCQIARELARHHIKGVVQSDLHMDNFMLRGQTVFSLDVAQISFKGRALGRRASLRGLGKLLACLSEGRSSDIASMAAVYAEERRWRWNPQDSEALKKRVRATRWKVTRKLVRRTLRTASQTLRFRQGRFRGVFDKPFLGESSTIQFCETLDALLREGRVLKDGNTCFVTRVRWRGHDLVIKRYNHKGFWHSLRHTLKGSRARRSWLNAHLLGRLGIPTARPVAYIEQRRGPFLWQSYFIMRFVPGMPVSSLFRSEQASNTQKQQVHEHVLSLLGRMAKYSISHGDMKHMNILFDGDRIILMDLDGMTVGWPGCLWRRRSRRDIDRYLRGLPNTEIARSSALYRR